MYYTNYVSSHTHQNFNTDRKILLRLTCKDRLLDPLLDLDSIGGLLFVAPRPANKLFSKDGLRAHIKAWNDETVKTPSLFKVFFVALDTCVSRDCNKINQAHKLIQ